MIQLKRALLFALVNALVLSTLWLAFYTIAGAVGLQYGMETRIWYWYSGIGFAGAILSLAYARPLAVWSMAVRIIKNPPADTRDHWVLETVHTFARKAGLKVMPDVGVYPSFEVNAFATGPSKDKALVAVSEGMLDFVSRETAEGILAHEVAHIANGDMVTMTLLQGVLNSMVLLAARIIARLASNSADAKARGAVYFLTYVSLQIVFSSLGSILVCYLSRRRELRADRAAGVMIGREKFIAGLTSLRPVYGDVDDTHQALSTLRISGHSARALTALFLTHPTLDARLQRMGVH